MEVELNVFELRELFGELKQKIIMHHAKQAENPETKSIVESVLKIEMYLNADFRNLWLWERQLAKPKEPEETGYTYFE
ncbi:MAG: hypothetical protein EBU66_11040 [Bacteroidetes bacterium]|jgi:hypothetical protein|nr:hypothetical protein [bacterium]NBP65174.1 hypothetical protein [Bacteroidota bacterium]